MPVINPPKLSEFYAAINKTIVKDSDVDIDGNVTISTTTTVPPKGYVLASDGDGGTSYISGNETLYFSTLHVTSISSYSVTIFGANTFTCEGNAFFDGSVFMSSIQLNSQDGPVAIGYQAGASNQGQNAIAIGNYAGQEDQPTNTLIFNATGAPLNISPILNPIHSVLIDPIRQDSIPIIPNTSNLPVYWNSDTKEIIQGPLYNPDTHMEYSAADAFVSSFTNSESTITQAIAGISSINDSPYIYFEIVDNYIQSTIYTSTFVTTYADMGSMDISSINTILYVPNYRVSTFSTLVVKDWLVADSISTQELLTSSINGVIYEPYSIVSTLSTCSLDGRLDTDSISTQSLDVSTINGYVYGGIQKIDAYFGITVNSTLITQKLSTAEILISSINGIEYVPFSIISTLSTTRVSSILAADSVSVQSMLLSSINNSRYVQYRNISTFSTVTVDDSVITKSISTRRIFVSSINDIKFEPFRLVSTLNTVFISSLVRSRALSTQELTISSINARRFEPFSIMSTLSTAFVNRSTLTKTLSTQELKLSTLNRVKYQPFYIVSSFSTIFASTVSVEDRISTLMIDTKYLNGYLFGVYDVISTISTVTTDTITADSVSTQDLYISTIFGIPYLPEETLSTLTLSTFTVSSVTTDTLSTNGLEVTLINGEEYNGNRDLSTFSTLIVSSLIAATITSEEFYFLTINGGSFALPVLTDITISSIEVSSFLNADTVSTLQFTTSSINGAIYDPYLILSTISSVVVEGTVEGDYVTTESINTTQLSTGFIQGSITTLDSFSTYDVSTTQSIGGSMAISSLIGYTVFAGDLTSGTDIAVNSLSTDQLSTALVTGGIATISEIRTDRISTGTLVGTTFSAESLSTNALFVSSIFAGTIYASTVIVLINTTCTTTRLTNTILSANVELVSSLQMFGNRGDYSLMTATTLSTGATIVGTGQVDVLSTNQISAGLLLGGVVKGVEALSTNSLSANFIQGEITCLDPLQVDRISSGSIQGQRDASFHILNINTLATEATEGDQIVTESLNTQEISTSSVQGGIVSCSSATAEHVVAGSVQGNQVSFTGVSTNTVVIGSMDGGSLGTFDTLSTFQIFSDTVACDSSVELGVLNARQIDAGSVVGTDLGLSSLSVAQLTTSSLVGTSYSAFSVLNIDQVSSGSFLCGAVVGNTLTTNRITADHSLEGDSAAFHTLNTQQLYTGSLEAGTATLSPLDVSGELGVGSITGIEDSLASFTSLSIGQLSTGTTVVVSTIFDTVTTDQLIGGSSVGSQGSISVLNTNQISSGSITGNLLSVKSISTSQITTGSLVGEGLVLNALTNNTVIGTGLTVAVGSSEGILYSSDGSNWLNVTGSPFSYGMGVAVDGTGTWVAVANSANSGYSVIQWSIDGSNWSNVNRIEPTFKAGWAVAYGNGMWVATGYDDDIRTDTILTSTDASNWYTPASVSFGVQSVTGVAYGLCNGVTPIWVVGGSGGVSPFLTTTTDPTGTWTNNSNIAFPITSIAYSPGKDLWVLGTAGGTVYTTSNPTGEWQTTTYNPNTTSPQLVWVSLANEYFFAVSGNHENYNSIIQLSTDGSNWSNANFGGIESGAQPYGSVGWNGSVYIAMGGSGSTQKLFYSANGSNWSAATGANFSAQTGIMIASFIPTPIVYSSASLVSTASVTAGSATYDLLIMKNPFTGSIVANKALIDSFSTNQLSTSSTNADFTSFETFTTNILSTLSASIDSGSLSSFDTDTISSGFVEVTYVSTVAIDISTINGVQYRNVELENLTISTVNVSTLVSSDTVSTLGLDVGFLNGQLYNPNEVISTFNTFIVSTIAADTTSTLGLEVSFINELPYFLQTYQTEASTATVSSILTTSIASTLNIDLYTINDTVYQTGSNITDITVAKVTKATTAYTISTTVVSTNTFFGEFATLDTLNTSSISTGFLNTDAVSTVQLFATYVNDSLYVVPYQPTTYSTILNSSIIGHTANYELFDTRELSTVSLTATRFGAFSAASTTQLSTGLILGGLLDSGDNLSTNTLSSGKTVGTLLEIAGNLTANRISTNTVTVAQLFVSSLFIDVQSSASIVVQNTATFTGASFEVLYVSTVSTYAVYGEFNDLTLGSLSTGFLTGGDARLNSLSTNTISTGSITSGSGFTVTSISTDTIAVGSIQGGPVSFMGLSTGQVSTGPVFGTSLTLDSLSTGSLSAIGPVQGVSLTLGSLSTAYVSTGSITGLSFSPLRFLSTGSMTAGSLQGTRLNTTDGLSTSQLSTGSLTGTSLSLLSSFYTRSISTGYLQADSVKFYTTEATSSFLVAVGSASNSPQSTIQWSTDGSNWIGAVQGGFSSNLGNNTYTGLGVAYSSNLNQWVAVGYGSSAANSILNSSDGSNWLNASSGGFSDSPTSFIGRAVTYGYNPINGIGGWVAVGYGTTTTISTFAIQTSTDGYSWNAIKISGDPLSNITTYANVTFGSNTNGSNYWVAVGRKGTDGTYCYPVYSTDTITWTAGGSINFASSGKVYGISYNPRTTYWTVTGLYNSLTNNPNYFINSNITSGSWTSIVLKGDPLPNANLQYVGFNSRYLNGTAYMIGLYNGFNSSTSNIPKYSILYSTNSSNYSFLASGGFEFIDNFNTGYDITYDGLNYYAIGWAKNTTSTILKSQDGINWSPTILSGGFSGSNPIWNTLPGPGTPTNKAGFGIAAKQSIPASQPNLTIGQYSTGSIVGETARFRSISTGSISTGSIQAGPSRFTSLSTGSISTGSLTAAFGGFDTLTIRSFSTIGPFQGSQASFGSLSTGQISTGPIVVQGSGIFMSLSTGSLSTFGPVQSGPVRLESLSTGAISTLSVVGLSTLLASVSTRTISSGSLQVGQATVSTVSLLAATATQLTQGGPARLTSLSTNTISTGSVLGGPTTFTTFNTGQVSTGSVVVQGIASFQSISTSRLSTGSILGGPATFITLSTGQISTASITGTSTTITVLSTGLLTTVGPLQLSNATLFTSLSTDTISTRTLIAQQQGAFLSLSTGTLSSLGQLQGVVVTTASLSTGIISTTAVLGQGSATFGSTSNGFLSTFGVQSDRVSLSSFTTDTISTGSSLFIPNATVRFTSLSTNVISTVTTFRGNPNATFSTMNLLTMTLSTTDTLITTSALFVAVGGSSEAQSTIQWSTDGLTWTGAITGGFTIGGSYSEAYSVAYDGFNRWVAVGTGNPSANSIQTSIDGSNWFDVTSGGFTQNSDGYGVGRGVAYGGGKWVAVGFGVNGTTSNAFRTSTDGLNWITPSIPDSVYPSFVAVAYGTNSDGSNYWGAVGTGSPGFSNCLFYSTDANTWFNNTGLGITSNKSEGIAYGAGKWVVTQRIGSNEIRGNILYSTDITGSTWITCPGVQSSNYASKVTYIPSVNRFYAFGNSWDSTETILYASPTDMVFSAVSGNFNTDGRDIAYDGSNYVVVGGTTSGISVDTILLSTDGSNWTNTVTSGGFTGGYGIAARPESTTLFPGFDVRGPARFASLSTNVISTGGFQATATTVSSIQITSILSTGSITGRSTSVSTVSISSINGFTYIDPTIRTINNSTFASSFVRTLSTLLTGSLSTLSTIADTGFFQTLSTISSISTGFINTGTVSTRSLFVSSGTVDGTLYQYPTSATYSTFVNVSTSLLAQSLNTFGTPFVSTLFGTTTGVGLIVAANSDNSTNSDRKRTLQYSTDSGATWCNAVSGGFVYATPPATFGLSIATDGNSRWAAGGQFATAATIIQYSTDGSNWSDPILPSGIGNSEYVHGIAYGLCNATNNPIWVATLYAATSYKIMYSTDARTWSSNVSFNPTGVAPGDVVFGYSNAGLNPVWVVGTGTSVYTTQNPSGSWTANTVASGISICSVAYSPTNNRWVCGTTTGQIYYTSTFTNPWTPVTLGASSVFVRWVNQYFLATVSPGNANTTATSNLIQRSTDGQTWSAAFFFNGVGNTTYNLQNGNAMIGWNGTNYVATGFTTGANNYFYLRSPDASNWTAVVNTNTIQYGARAIVGSLALPGGGLTVAVGYDTSSSNQTIKYSRDSGRTWANAASIPPSVYAVSVANDGVSQWAAAIYGTIGLTNGSIYRSSDGSNWNTTTLPVISNGWGITYANGVWVAVAAAQKTSTILTSIDSITWKSPTTLTWDVTLASGIAYGNGLWVAGGFQPNTLNISYLATATDPTGTWTSNATVTQKVASIAYSPTKTIWVFAGGSADVGVYYTTNPTGTWSNATSYVNLGTSRDTKWVTWANQYFFVVDCTQTRSNIIQRSSDGSNWQAANYGNGIPEKVADFQLYGSVSWDGNKYIAMGGINATSKFCYSIDGLVWTQSASGGFAQCGRSIASLPLSRQQTFLVSSIIYVNTLSTNTTILQSLSTQILTTSTINSRPYPMIQYGTGLLGSAGTTAITFNPSYTVAPSMTVSPASVGLSTVLFALSNVSPTTATVYYYSTINGLNYTPDPSLNYKFSWISMGL